MWKGCGDWEIRGEKGEGGGGDVLCDLLWLGVRHKEECIERTLCMQDWLEVVRLRVVSSGRGEERHEKPGACEVGQRLIYNISVKERQW